MSFTTCPECGSHAVMRKQLGERWDTETINMKCMSCGEIFEQ